MAINPQKFLPGSSSSAIVKTSAPTSLSKFSDIRPKGSDNTTLKVYKKVVKIDKLLRNNLKLSSKENEVSRKETENKNRQKKEQQLESPKKFKGFETIRNALPKTGILDSIKRFVLFTFAGWLFTRLFQFLPKLLGIVKFITPIYSWIEKGIGAFFEGLVGFIDLGYKAYDKVRSFAKQIGGENFQKVFDSFSSNLNKFLNLAIIAAMVAARSGVGFGGAGFGGGRGSRGAGGVGISGRGTGRGRVVDPSSARRYAERYGRDAAVNKFGPDGVRSLGGKYGRSRLTNLARKGAVSLVGKEGTKAALKFARPLVKRLPIIGGLVDFGLSVAMGEPLGRAAFKAIGAGILGAIGTGFGGPLGAIIGGFAGDWAGGMLYDIFFGGKKGSSKIQKKDKGGLVRRNSRQPSRTSTIIPSGTRKIKKLKRTKIKPGKDVGGKRKIEKLYPDPDSSSSGSGFNWLSSLFGGNEEEIKKNKYKLPNTLKTLVKLGENLGKSEDWVGALMSAGVQIALGQIPDIRAISSSITSALISARSSVSQGMDAVRKSISGFADGGLVSMNSYSRNDSSVFERALEGTIKKRVDDSLRGIRKELGKSGPRRGTGRDAMIEDNRTGGGGAAGGGGGGAGAPGSTGGEGVGDVPANAPMQLLKKELGVSESDWDLYRNSIALIESKGVYNISGGSGGYYDGRYQMGGEAKTDAARILGIKNPGHGAQSRAEFRKNAAFQEKMFAGYTIANHRYLMNSSKQYRDASIERKLQILGYAHNQGWSGAKNWLETGTVGADGFGTKGTKYTDLIRDNFKARKSGAKPNLASGAVAIESGKPEVSGSEVQALSSGFRTGLKTGPAGRIGAGTEYHVDARIIPNLPIKDKVAMIDSMAAAHAKEGYAMEFSGSGVGGVRWNTSLSYEQKVELAKKVLSSHHSPRPGWEPFDYYVVKQSAKDRFDKSAEGSNIMAPRIPDGTYEYQEDPGGYGRFMIIRDKNGRELFRIGHGDLGIASPKEIGKKFKMNELIEPSELTPSKDKVTRVKGTEAILNGKPVVWDGTKWISSSSPQAKELMENKEEEIKRQKEQQNAAKIQSQRPWWDKLGVFGGAAAEKQRQSVTPSTPSTPSPATGGGMGGRRGSGSSPSTMEGGGSINPRRPNVPNVASRALYETPGGSSMMAILPIRMVEKVPVPVGGGGGLPSFPIAGLNNSDSSYELMRG